MGIFGYNLSNYYLNLMLLPPLAPFPIKIVRSYLEEKTYSKNM